MIKSLPIKLIKLIFNNLPLISCKNMSTLLQKYHSITLIY